MIAFSCLALCEGECNRTTDSRKHLHSSAFDSSPTGRLRAARCFNSCGPISWRWISTAPAQLRRKCNSISKQKGNFRSSVVQYWLLPRMRKVCSICNVYKDRRRITPHVRNTPYTNVFFILFHWFSSVHVRRELLNPGTLRLHAACRLPSHEVEVLHQTEILTCGDAKTRLPLTPPPPPTIVVSLHPFHTHPRLACIHTTAHIAHEWCVFY